MTEPHIVSLGSIVVLAGGAQWLAWRLRLPSILLLLAVGFIAGPVVGLIHPDTLFGESLFPIISVSVAVLLFEGGLSLKFKHIRGHGQLVTKLISVGIIVAWLATAALAHWVLGYDWQISLLLGAILSVSGPTVVGPLLRHIRPPDHVGSVLRWEGILIDSIGALLAILVFGAVVQANEVTLLGALLAVLKTAVLGSLIGVAGAAVILLALKRFWVPDYLQVSLSLMAVVGVYLTANLFQSEAGLFAVTVMGIALINQHWVSVEHIVEFKENLSVLLIGGLFIVLASRLTLADLSFLDWRLGLFVAGLVLVVRPLMVAVSARKSAFSFKEKALLAGVYPRGIVAVAVASIFAISLEASGYPAAGIIKPVVFLSVIGTVLIYGLLSLPYARLLGLSKPHPTGVFFVGADEWVRALATVLQQAGVTVRLVDEHWSDIKAAQAVGLPARHIHTYHEHLADEVETGDVGYLLAVNESDEINSLVAAHYLGVFDRKHIFQLPFDIPADGPLDSQEPYLVGRALFSRSATAHAMATRFREGACFSEMALDAGAELERVQAERGQGFLPICLIRESGQLDFCTVSNRPKPRSGDRLVYMCPPKDGVPLAA
jgi:NhaP-type Na+/H+ or K+/H+ antiporter